MLPDGLPCPSAHHIVGSKGCTSRLLLLRSSPPPQAVHAAGYDWSLVRPFTSSLSFLDALPILAFGFQVSHGCGSVHACFL